MRIAIGIFSIMLLIFGPAVLFQFGGISHTYHRVLLALSPSLAAQQMLDDFFPKTTLDVSVEDMKVDRSDDGSVHVLVQKPVFTDTQFGSGIQVGFDRMQFTLSHSTARSTSSLDDLSGATITGPNIDLKSRQAAFFRRENRYGDNLIYLDLRGLRGQVHGRRVEATRLTLGTFEGRDIHQLTAQGLSVLQGDHSVSVEQVNLVNALYWIPRFLAADSYGNDPEVAWALGVSRPSQYIGLTGLTVDRVDDGDTRLKNLTVELTRRGASRRRVSVEYSGLSEQLSADLTLGSQVLREEGETLMSSSGQARLDISQDGELLEVRDLDLIFDDLVRLSGSTVLTVSQRPGWSARMVHLDAAIEDVGLFDSLAAARPRSQATARGERGTVSLSPQEFREMGVELLAEQPDEVRLRSAPGKSASIAELGDPDVLNAFLRVDVQIED